MRRRYRGRAADDRCLGTLGVHAAPATWTMTQTIDASTCTVALRPTVVLEAGAGASYELVPADPAIDITASFRQPQVAASGCAEYNAIDGADDAIVDGAPARVELRWELVVLDDDGDFEISGTVEGTAPNGCAFTGTVTGRYALD